MAATNVQAFSGDVELNGIFTINSSVGNIKKKSFASYSASGLTRYWKVASGNYDGARRNHIKMTVNIHRIDTPNSTHRLVMEADGGSLTFRPCIDEHESGTPSYPRDLRVYKNTSDTTFDIYIQVSSYSYVDVEMMYSGNSITVYDTPTWETAEPTTSGTYLLEFTNGNLNAMKINNAGYVGIGTNGPGKELTVNGNMEIGTGDADYQHLRIGGGNSSGFLYGAFAKYNDGIHMGYNFYNDNTSNQIPNTGGGTSRISMRFGQIQLHTGGVNTEPNNNALTINSVGNVGIGKTDPSCTLDVSGSGQYEGIYSKRIWVANIGDNSGDGTPDDNTGSPWRGLGFDNLAWNDDSYKYSADIPILSGYNGVALRSGAGNLILTTAGDVGIGTTNPGNKLDVRKDITTGSSSTTHLQTQFKIGNATFTAGKALMGYSGRASPIINAATYWNGTSGYYGTSGYFGIAVNDASIGGGDPYGITDGELESQTRIAIRTDGNVGIGSTTPTGQLEIHGAGQTSQTSFSQTGNMGGVLALRSDDGGEGSGGAVMFGTHAGFHAAIKASLQDGASNTRGRLRFFIRNNAGDATMSHAMTIAAEGHLGIAATSPFARLTMGSANSTSGYVDEFAFRSANNTAIQRVGYVQRIGFWSKSEYGFNNIMTGAIECLYGDNQHYPVYPGHSSTNLIFKTNNRAGSTGIEKMRLNYDGNLGVGTNNPTSKLYVNGSLYYTSLTAGSSDDRIKYNEENVSNALSLISQLNPQKYEKIMEHPQNTEGTWIPTDEEWENVKENYKYGDEFGFIAQDVRSIPELSFLVSGEETRTETKTVTLEEYSNLTTEEQNTYSTPTYNYVSTEDPISVGEYSNLLPEEQNEYYQLPDESLYKKHDIDSCTYSESTPEVQQTYTQTLSGYTKQIETETPLGLNYQGLFVVAIGAIQELKAKNDALEARILALESA
jgi:hypothetical protein